MFVRTACSYALQEFTIDSQSFHKLVPANILNFIFSWHVNIIRRVSLKKTLLS